MSGADAAARLERILAELTARGFGEPAGEPEPLDGGITNRNYRVRLGERDVVLRLPGDGTELLGIDRDAECEATEAAACAGVGAPFVAFVEGERCLVTQFIAGRPLQDGELQTEACVGDVARALRAFHAGPPLRAVFDPFRIVERYAATARERGAALPPAFETAAAAARELEPLVQGGEHAPVPCHNDLLAANLLHDGERVRIVDWEYAGMNDRYFDLANLSVNNGFGAGDDDRLLAAYFGAPPTDARRAALGVMKVMSDFREAMWGAVQSAVSSLDVDFEAYAREHFERLERTVAAPAHQEHLAVLRA